ncbi:DNA methyltransferase [Fictibacillus phosphorivorans]|uniref:DNA methyltransferase n=1 Tax=Fictibacillus phosphorivorans TaxID=1221500 RepID=UPI0012933174|nr:DNA methyltransferase [Fictibacillus phosphorivorans]MQR94196.1 site-specific DNA-methyltransferase [Fictibacillus phosphorivorans]
MKLYEDLSKEELINIIEKIKRRKKYGLVWDEDVTPEYFLQEKKDSYPVIKYIEEKSIIKYDDAPNHVLIEGDNFHSLFTLNYTHQKAFSLIYIDPPYNTGSNDFSYNDTFVDKSDTYRHSKWIAFMEKRLRLAKRLLKDDGCIFISINEEEAAQLKLLCDEVFDEKNYLTMFTIKVRHEDRILTGDKDFQEVVEYLLMYRKTSKFKPVKIEKDNTSIEEYQYEINELAEPLNTVTWDNKTVQIFDENSYEIVKSEPSDSKLKRLNIRGTLRKSNTSGRFYVKHIEPEYKDKPGYLFKVLDMGNDDKGFRYFLSPPIGRVNGDYFQGVPVNRKDIREVPFPNYFDFEKEFNNVGYEGGVEFKNGKKPIDFLLKIFELSRLKEDEDAKVLDFFAGSGSVAHALMVFNDMYGGNRQAVICTKNKEIKMNVVDEATLPRMRNVINGYTLKRKETFVIEEEKLNKKNIKKANEIFEVLEEKSKELIKAGLYDEVKIELEEQSLKLIGTRKKSSKYEGYYANLRYFETEFIKKTVNPDQLKLDITERCSYLLALKENVFDLYEEHKSFKIFKEENKVLAIYYEMFGKDLEELKASLDLLHGEKTLYMFTLDPLGINKEDFKGWEVNVEPIPKDILDVFEEVMKLND